MNSWQILRTLFNVSESAESPLYYFELMRPPRWWAAIEDLITNSPRVMLVLTGVSCYLCSLLTQHIGPLVVLLTLLPLIGMVMVSLNVASVVAQEREHHTWELLRIAPFSIETLLLSRAAGRLWWMRDSLRALFGLLVVIAAFLGCASTLLVPPPPGTGLIWWSSLSLAILSMVLILLDRVQQFVLIIVTALAAGSSVSSARSALTVSIASVIVVWTIDLGAAAIVSSRAHLELDLLIEQALLASLLGPVASYVAIIPSSHGLVYAALTLIIREVIVYLLWRYTTWIACTA